MPDSACNGCGSQGGEACRTIFEREARQIYCRKGIAIERFWRSCRKERLRQDRVNEIFIDASPQCNCTVFVAAPARACANEIVDESVSRSSISGDRIAIV